MDKRCRCGLPSLPGLSINPGLCQRHYDEYQWGKGWAEECSRKQETEVEGMGIRVWYAGVYPEEAVRNAYAQYVHKDWNTWGYQKYNGQVKRRKRTFQCGPFRIRKQELRQ